VVGQRVAGEETVKIKVIVKVRAKEKEKKILSTPPPHTHTHATVSTNVPYTYSMILIMEYARSHSRHKCMIFSLRKQYTAQIFVQNKLKLSTYLLE